MLSDNLRGIVNGLCFLLADAGLNDSQRMTMERMLRNASDALGEAFRVESKKVCPSCQIIGGNGCSACGG